MWDSSLLALGTCTTRHAHLQTTHLLPAQLITLESAADCMQSKVKPEATATSAEKSIEAAQVCYKTKHHRLLQPGIRPCNKHANTTPQTIADRDPTMQQARQAIADRDLTMQQARQAVADRDRSKSTITPHAAVMESVNV